MIKKRNTSYETELVCFLMVPAAFMLMSFIWMHNGLRHESNKALKGVTGTPDIAPVDFTKVTKVVLFGERMHPQLNELRDHTGIDFELIKGSDVVATADGVVIVQSYGEKQGNYVVIKHNETFTTRYFHLESALVKHGDKIKRNQVIGKVGNTGLSNVPHLHYEVVKDGKAVDPKEYLPTLPSL